MRRHLALLSFALGRGWRRPSTFVITLALTLVVFSLASTLFLTEALRREAQAAVAALPDLTIQHLVAGRPSLIPVRNLRDITAIPGVLSVRPRVWGYYFIPNLSGNLTVVGADTTIEGVRSDLALVIGRGRLPLPGASGEIILGEGLAAFLGLEVGDDVGFPVGRSTKILSVVGVFHSEVAMWTADVILMSVPDARQLLNVPEGHATDLAVQLSTPDEATVAARKIEALMPGSRIVDRHLLSRTYDLTFDHRGGVMGAMLLSALMAFLIIAWDRLTGVGPGERREIGVLKAIGWQTRDVLTARLWENALMAGHGALAGLLMAYLYVFRAQAPGLYDVLVGWSSIYPKLQLAPQFDAGQVLVVLGLVVVPFVAISIVPAWRAATCDPHDLLRGGT